MDLCPVCCKRILPHSKHLRCCTCKRYYHIKCLPYVNKDDSIYVNRDHNDWLCTGCSCDIFPYNHVDDDTEFIHNLSENWENKTNVIRANIVDKIFTPFEQEDFDSLHMMDYDPDANYYQNLYNTCINKCDYYHEDSFNSKCKDLCIRPENLALIHSNIRSLPCNLDKFTQYINGLDVSFSVMAFTETWLKPHNEHCYGINGYNVEHNSRLVKTGGGVSMFIKEGIEYTKRTDLYRMSNIMESLFIEIDRSVFKCNNNIIIGVIYRPPDTDIDSFNECLNEIVSTLKTERKTCYILGDYNVNLFNADSHGATQDFIDMMYSHSLFPTITKPTRITAHSATLIDNVFCNDALKEEALSGILYTDISDHLPVFYIDYTMNVAAADIYISKRSYSLHNMNLFRTEVGNHDWSTILSQNDAQLAYSLFYKDFTCIYNRCFPVRTVKLGYKNRKPWLSEGLKKSIKIKNSLYILYKKHNTEELELRYKQYRNRLHSLLKKAEREHYDTLFETYKGNLKKSWNLIKDIINKNQSRACSSKFNINGSCVTDKSKIANGFNSYFVNIGPTLANDIPESKKSPIDNMGERNKFSFFVNPTSEAEVTSVIKALKNSAPGYDSISAVAIKNTIGAFISPLTHIMNLSLSSGVFPHELKTARVIPLFKSGDPMMLSNYRPVSVLPFFSKVLERLMYNRLISFINKHNLLYDFQFGFRDRRSTNTAMVYLVDKISNLLDNGDYVLGLFLDFTKAFDTVNHSILLRKLDHLGIRGVPLKWFESYLATRTQYVDFGGVSSDTQYIKCGVPQGSILGPLLFLLYINDLSRVSSVIFSLLFADDSNMFMSGRNPNTMIKSMNVEMVKIIEWLQVNKLTLNVKKTHYMFFRKLKSKLIKTEDILINGHVIDMVEVTKFLGVQIDMFLTWRQHIQYIKGKIARGLGIICKARKVLNQGTLLTLYNCFVLPYLTYCIEVWGLTYKSYIDPLVKIQKKALRIITGSHRLAHTEPIFKELKVLTVEKLYMYAVQMFMFKFHNGLLPNIFGEFFVVNADIHGHNTRQSHYYHSVLRGTDQTSRRIRLTGVATHNFFSDVLDFKYSIGHYKTLLKRYLILHDCSNIITHLA